MNYAFSAFIRCDLPINIERHLNKKQTLCKAYFHVRFIEIGDKWLPKLAMFLVHWRMYSYYDTIG